MSFRFVTRIVAVAGLLGVTLGGCNDLYTARRDTLSLVSGDAIAVNRVTHTIDPWSSASSQRSIAYNGEVAGCASERYRTGKVIRPVSASTSQAAPVAATGAAGGGGGSPGNGCGNPSDGGSSSSSGSGGSSGGASK